MINTNYGIPEIFYPTNRNLAIIYNDIKCVLKVPIVNFIFRTLALYEDFLTLAWNEVRLNALTKDFLNAADQIKPLNLNFDLPTINWNQFYNEKEITEIKKIVFTFNYVNPKLLLIAAMWYESLGNRPILGKEQFYGFIEPGIIPGLPDIELVQIEDAPEPIKLLLKDIINKHHTLDAASDFRALAKYPLFLEKSWSSFESIVGSPVYSETATLIKKRAIELAHEMPYKINLNPQLLAQFYSNKDIAGIMGVLTMFLNFLPDLIIDGYLFNKIIEQKN